MRWTELIIDDEENLRRHAARGAQAAVKAAKDRAQAFDDSRGGKEEALDRELPLLFSSSFLKGIIINTNK